MSLAQRYKALTPGPGGQVWSEVLHLWLGTWEGEFQGEQAVWLRFFDAEGQLVLTGEEVTHAEAQAERQRAEAAEQRAKAAEQRAEVERQRAEVERQRAEAAETELSRLRARLAELEDET